LVQGVQPERSAVGLDPFDFPHGEHVQRSMLTNQYSWLLDTRINRFPHSCNRIGESRSTQRLGNEVDYLLCERIDRELRMRRDEHCAQLGDRSTRRPRE